MKKLTLVCLVLLLIIPSALAIDGSCEDLSRTLFFLLIVIGGIGVLVSLYGMFGLMQNRALAQKHATVLRDYVAKARKLGMKNEKIEVMLENYGYHPKEIEAVLKK